MKKLFIVLALLFAVSASGADTPPCRMGTDWAINPARVPAKGEWAFTAPKGGVVIMEHRATPGGSKILEVRCSLPEDIEAFAPAPGTHGNPWAKVCGNSFVPEGWSIPLPPGFLDSLKGERGERGERGDKGEKGDRDESWRSRSQAPPRPLCGESWRTGRRWGCTVIVTLVTGGLYAATQGSNDGRGPGGNTGPAF